MKYPAYGLLLLSFGLSPAQGEAHCPPINSDTQSRELCFISQETSFTAERIVHFLGEAKARNIGPAIAIEGLRSFSARLRGIQLQGQEEVTFFAQHQALGF
jgi:hypothetical protein